MFLPSGECVLLYVMYFSCLKLLGRDLNRMVNIYFSEFYNFINSINLPLMMVGELNRFYHEIYPPELEMQHEKRSNTDTSFLGINIKIFPLVFIIWETPSHFLIVIAPYLCSNMPSKIFCTSYGAEI